MGTPDAAARKAEQDAAHLRRGKGCLVAMGAIVAIIALGVFIYAQTPKGRSAWVQANREVAAENAARDAKDRADKAASAARVASARPALQFSAPIYTREGATICATWQELETASGGAPADCAVVTGGVRVFDLPDSRAFFQEIHVRVPVKGAYVDGWTWVAMLSNDPNGS